MAITPINFSRVSHNLQTMSLLDSLRRNALTLFLEQNRLASGNRLNAPSEDPVLAARATQLSEVLEQQDQLLSNISHADSLLTATDYAIGEINDMLIDAHNIALTMINTTAGSDERQAEAQLVLGIIDQLVTVGNRRYGDIYLFGGQQTQRTPFTQDQGVAEYRGDTGALRSHVDAGQDPAINLTGAELFGALAGGVDGYVDLNPALTTDTRLVDVTGTGTNAIQLGTIRISLTAPEVSFTADLSSADTAGDVIDMINGAAEQAGLTVGPGNEFNIGFNAAGDGFQIDVNGGTATVAEVGNGITARDLGILGSGASIVGADVNPQVTAMTTIASLFGGAGAVLGNLRIENGHLSADVDLSGATTVQEILNRINTSGMEVRAQINGAGTGIDVLNLASGLQMTIAEAGGTTAGLLGIRSYYGGTLLSDMNQGRGVQIREGYDDLSIRTKSDVTFTVNLDGSQTVQDVIDKINAAATAAAVALTASLAVNGNGIRIVDATGGPNDLVISRADMSYAIDGLGLDKSTSGTEIVGDDVNGIVPDSVFTALHDLYEGLMHDDEILIGDAAGRIETFTQSASRLQGEVGARSKAMHARLDFTEDAVVSTRTLLSQVKDLDYTEAITRFQQAQTTLQANLMTGSRLMQLSLLDFIR